MSDLEMNHYRKEIDALRLELQDCRRDTEERVNILTKRLEAVGEEKASLLAELRVLRAESEEHGVRRNGSVSTLPMAPHHSSLSILSELHISRLTSFYCLALRTVCLV